MELKWKHFIDAGKGATPLVVLGLIKHFDRWESPTAWVYFGIHGSYGVMWCLKSQIFPDSAWERPIKPDANQKEMAKKYWWNPMDVLPTILPSCIGGPTIFASLAGYWGYIYHICANKVEVPAWALGSAVFTYSIGVFLHFTSDMQKHVQIQMRTKPGLITDMFFARSRNPNYLGELLIYGSFAALANNAYAAGYCAYNVLCMWLPNMLKKDISISRHAGWEEYKARSGLIFPSLFSWSTPKKAQA
eukprot:TRINITY_DN22532_c0_g1_i1.p1 TRINITY_DN22532_c0_g1~~TRINITY_DN22532_c0_g1_i1.p1  ORF type:complete len:246 (+),score=73.77 TRINITY_DN22532_c0_g1_i1:49-786(+)